ncbi:MAG: glucose-6-phosphate dehydrogenase [Sedimentisphaerales bacterium]|nr:glucose-6-phosphate dehydrogenase [Sedimentisphaerales bacterium]
MRQVGLSISRQEIICAETAAGPNGLVVFGASGDLVRRKLLISLFRLFQHDLLSEHFYLLGIARTKLSDEQFRRDAQQAIRQKSPDVSPEYLEEFTDRLYYISGDYGDMSLYAAIAPKIAELNLKHHIDGSLVFYLSVPPFLYGTIIEQLGMAGLSCPMKPDLKSNIKLVVEKPFGKDLQSSMDLSEKIHRCFDESQVYRIDHYLGKETVQNILMFRFANAIFEPIWNRNYIDHVQITIAESVGVEHRGSYYDKSGALRDMFQNHMLQMLTLAAMEPPISFEADSIRDEKVKLLRSIRPFRPDEKTSFVRGQYTEGLINGKKVPGYLAEPTVGPDSKTETFVAAKLFIDNWRWKDVPFYLRTGKRMAAKDTEIAITFKSVPHSMFSSMGLDIMPPNVLILQIQPQEGILLNFQAKRPGSKSCISTLTMNFSYEELFGTEAPEAYERLLLDCMLGDQTLFTRQDAIEAAWRLLTPIMESWEKNGSVLYQYPAGAESFPAANELIESDGRKWYKLLRS